MKKIAFIVAFVIGYAGYSQVGIGTPLPNKSAQLDIESKNKGVLIPRLALTSVTDNTTITNGNINSLLVFNTATTSDLKPGYYYWYNDTWVRIVDVRSLEDSKYPKNIVIYNPVTENYTYLDENGDSQVINIEGGPWLVSGTDAKATNNDQNIYQMGNVGIGISKPTAKLHSEGTLRHQGLEEKMSNTSFMTTDKDGNVSLRKSNTFLPYFISPGLMGTDLVLDSNAKTTTSKNGSVQESTKVLYEITFNIEQESLVVLSYNISYTNLLAADGKSGLNDGIAKWIGMLILFSDLPEKTYISTIAPIVGRNSTDFSSSNGSYVAGKYYFTGTQYMHLTPGSHTLNFLVGVATHDEDSQGVSVEFGSGDDRIGIVGIPVN